MIKKGENPSLNTAITIPVSNIYMIKDLSILFFDSNDNNIKSIVITERVDGVFETYYKRLNGFVPFLISSDHKCILVNPKMISHLSQDNEQVSILYFKNYKTPIKNSNYCKKLILSIVKENSNFHTIIDEKVCYEVKNYQKIDTIIKVHNRYFILSWHKAIDSNKHLIWDAHFTEVVNGASFKSVGFINK